MLPDGYTSKTPTWQTQATFIEIQYNVIQLLSFKHWPALLVQRLTKFTR